MIKTETKVKRDNRKRLKTKKWKRKWQNSKTCQWKC